MMQRWSADTVRFMRDASEYGSYHHDLARALLPYLPVDGHICDAGCGLGHLAFELSKFCKEVTAVDASEAALNVLQNRELPDHLHVIHGDVFQLDTKFDAMIFCYFGNAEQIMELAFRKCCGTMLVVRRDCGAHRFSGTYVLRKEHSVNHLTRILNERKVPYISKGLSLELGQPFRSMEDVRCFFGLYNKSEEPFSVDQLRGRLILTGDQKFPFYYPSVRDMELIVFKTDHFL